MKKAEQEQWRMATAVNLEMTGCLFQMKQHLLPLKPAIYFPCIFPYRINWRREVGKFYLHNNSGIV